MTNGNDDQHSTRDGVCVTLDAGESTALAKLFQSLGNSLLETAGELNAAVEGSGVSKEPVTDISVLPFIEVCMRLDVATLAIIESDLSSGECAADPLALMARRVIADALVSFFEGYQRTQFDTAVKAYHDLAANDYALMRTLMGLTPGEG